MTADRGLTQGSRRRPGERACISPTTSISRCPTSSSANLLRDLRARPAGGGRQAQLTPTAISIAGLDRGGRQLAAVHLLWGVREDCRASARRLDAMNRGIDPRPAGGVERLWFHDPDGTPMRSGWPEKSSRQLRVDARKISKRPGVRRRNELQHQAVVRRPRRLAHIWCSTRDIRR